MPIVNICNRIIEYFFYALFLLVPLALASNTSELFEFNKMWLTYGIALIIAAAWGVRMVLQRKIFVQRTLLDIPIALFLVAQVISTIFSWDFHVSFWGYYSRFNGGLLSIITYIFLYYAFLSNFPAVLMVKRLIFVSLLAGLVVTLWGLPSHFGYDPTCLLFRGELNVSCWTEDFQPKVRIFSTLGQPSWLAAYLAILIPISIAMVFNNLQSKNSIGRKYQVLSIKYYVQKKSFIHTTYYILHTALFYPALLYANTRSGFLAVWISLAFLSASIFWLKKKSLSFIIYPSSFILLFLVLITFFIGQPFSQLDKFTFEGIKKTITTSKTKDADSKKTPIQQRFAGELGGTDSGKIRTIVWQGAVNIWKNYPIFGTGVETFAFAYYKYKPPQHNLTSEWNFLYNKAHNEFLNYLATTGIVGLAAYLSMIIVFFVVCIKYYVSSIRNKIHNTYYIILTTSLLASYLSILVTNFFGFSVVITNIYLFMIPAFVFVLGGMTNPEKILVFPKNESRIMNHELRISRLQWILVFSIILASCFLLLNLIKFWIADTNYAYGKNLDRAGKHVDANSYLRSAHSARSNEPVFKDALSVNNANVAVDLLNTVSEEESDSNQTVKIASNLANEAINLSNEITLKHPTNVVFWKNRVRMFYALSQADLSYLSSALSSIKKAGELAPNDASILYNLGVLYGQNADIENGVKILEKTINLKPDYRDARFALGLFYRELAIDENKKVVDAALQKKAVEQMQYILNHLSPNDSLAQEALESWKKN